MTPYYACFAPRDISYLMIQPNGDDIIDDGSTSGEGEGERRSRDEAFLSEQTLILHSQSAPMIAPLVGISAHEGDSDISPSAASARDADHINTRSLLLANMSKGGRVRDGDGCVSRPESEGGAEHGDGRSLSSKGETVPAVKDRGAILPPV